MSDDRTRELLEARHYSIIIARKPDADPLTYIIFTDNASKAGESARKCFDRVPETEGIEFTVTDGRTFYSNKLAEMCIREARIIPLS